MRRPVRGDVRLASGFGMRFHPLLNERRMHTGVDWATSPGTPILAAGTGVIEEAGRKGQYGNYVRIRHPNGYHTAYGHMLRFRKGVAAGVKVRQGEIIGYVGSTGLASGPHLHYEVLINSPLRRSAGHPGAARARAHRARSSPSSRRSARASTTCATWRRS